MSDFIGKLLGRLKIIDLTSVKTKNGKPRKAFIAKCACDNKQITVDFYAVLNGRIKSCGCLQKEGRREPWGDKQVTSIYKIWCNIKDRLKRKNSYKNVEIYSAWEHNPDAFEKYILDTLGGPPSPWHSLDRINNLGHYEPNNLRWATPQEQARNRTNNVLVNINDKTVCLAEASEMKNISVATVRRRIERGLSKEDALNKPVREYSENFTFNGSTKTYTEWRKETGVKQQTFSKRKNEGWTIEEALGLVPKLNGKHLFVFDGNADTYLPIKKVAEITGYSVSAITRKKRQGMLDNELLSLRRKLD